MLGLRFQRLYQLCNICLLFGRLVCLRGVWLEAVADLFRSVFLSILLMQSAVVHSMLPPVPPIYCAVLYCAHRDTTLMHRASPLAIRVWPVAQLLLKLAGSGGEGDAACACKYKQ